MSMETLFRQFWPYLVGCCLRWTGDGPLAEDLAAQTFVRALEAERDGRGPHSAPWGWLITIARRLWIDQSKSSERRRTVGWEEAFAWYEPIDDGEADEDALDAALTIAWMLPFLTSDQRAVVQLYDLEEMDIAEVAQRVGKRVGAAKALRLRGVRQMRRCLGIFEE